MRATQAEFAPVDCGEGLWIVPGWHAPPAAARTVVRLDPGMAFGTGTHPTTRMCLSFLARRAAAGAPWPRVLDYGTGSGILAIAAARLGATEVDAVDIDPAAVEAARENARANGVGVLDRRGQRPVLLEQAVGDGIGEGRLQPDRERVHRGEAVRGVQRLCWSSQCSR